MRDAPASGFPSRELAQIVADTPPQSAARHPARMRPPSEKTPHVIGVSIAIVPALPSTTSDFSSPAAMSRLRKRHIVARSEASCIGSPDMSKYPMAFFSGVLTPMMSWLHAKRQSPSHPCCAAHAPVTMPPTPRNLPGAEKFHSVMVKGLSSSLHCSAHETPWGFAPRSGFALPVRPRSCN